jgi:hypothetical protein
MPWEAQKGPAIDYAMLGAIREFGQDDKMVAVLADHIKIKPQAVSARLAALTAVQPADDERGGQEWVAFFVTFSSCCC